MVGPHDLWIANASLDWDYLQLFSCGAEDRKAHAGFDTPAIWLKAFPNWRA
jgi:hypothetical protein